MTEGEEGAKDCSKTTKLSAAPSNYEQWSCCSDFLVACHRQFPGSAGRANQGRRKNWASATSLAGFPTSTSLYGRPPNLLAAW